jgi:DNA-binding CsgD family transcriptional regulator
MNSKVWMSRAAITPSATMKERFQSRRGTVPLICVTASDRSGPPVFKGADAAAQTLSQLTPRESEVLALLGEGKTSKEIASILNTAVATVASHRKSLCRKLNAHSVAELVHRATAIGRVSGRSQSAR